ncbi:hypothetical protein GCM10027447_06210 [Glycomyces halotolerans]
MWEAPIFGLPGGRYAAGRGAPDRGGADRCLFGGGWRFTEAGPGRTEATWKYTFSCRPGLLRPLTEPIGHLMLRRDIERRIDAFATACSDPQITAAALEE